MKVLRGHKLLLLIPAVLLLSIFIGMIPLNMVHRLTGGCAFVFIYVYGQAACFSRRFLQSRYESIPDVFRSRLSKKIHDLQTLITLKSLSFPSGGEGV